MLFMKKMRNENQENWENFWSLKKITNVQFATKNTEQNWLRSSPNSHTKLRITHNKFHKSLTRTWLNWILFRIGALEIFKPPKNKIKIKSGPSG